MWNIFLPFINSEVYIVYSSMQKKKKKESKLIILLIEVDFINFIKAFYKKPCYFYFYFLYLKMHT